MSLLPSMSELMTKTPLYTIYKLDKNLTDEVHNIRCFEGSIDSFCPKCGKDSTFIHIMDKRIEQRQSSVKIWKLTGDQFKTELSDYRFYEVFLCTRNFEHRLVAYFYADNGYLVKVGQYPAIADLEDNDISKYRKIADPEVLREFTRAIMLKTHGIGVGSFVYLRRIFEKLLEHTYSKMKAEGGMDLEQFNHAPIDKRMALLESELPDILVKNELLNEILRKGIYELTEDECLKHFELLKSSIDLMFTEILFKTEHEERLNQVKKAVEDLQQPKAAVEAEHTEAVGGAEQVNETEAESAMRDEQSVTSE